MKLFLLVSLFFAAFISRAQFEGQWLTNKALSDCTQGDTIEITKSKFKDSFFQWGQPPFGIEFGKDSSFSEFYTVMCSTESSPLVNSDEKWKTGSKDVVFISGDKRNLQLKIIWRKEKKMRLVLL